MKSTGSKKISFSVRPWENVGFTDQLLQFSSLYKLGRSLGWAYRHQDFTNQRSSASVFDYLGFNEYMHSVSKSQRDHEREEEPTEISLHLSDVDLGRAGVSSLYDLQEFVRLKANSILEENGFPFGTTFSFSLKKGSSRSFFSLIDMAIPDLPDQLDLFSGFRECRSGICQSGAFQDRPIKLLFHMRLGDTAFLKTPWNSFIYREFSGGVYRKPTQSETLADLAYIVPADYLRVARSLLSFFPPGTVSCAFHSDGYGRLYREVLAHSTHLGLSSDQIVELQEAGKSYDAIQFAEFDTIEGANLFIGERDDYLFDLIDTIFSADLIVIGRIQRMIPKFLAVYANTTSPRKVLVIGKDQRHPNYSGLGLGEDKAKFAGISVETGSLDGQVGSSLHRLLPEFSEELLIERSSTPENSDSS